eukprot:5331040-Prymnesium_polylepis.1
MAASACRARGSTRSIAGHNTFDCGPRLPTAPPPHRTGTQAGSSGSATVKLLDERVVEGRALCRALDRLDKGRVPALL